jgi:hypothetical protein
MADAALLPHYEHKSSKLSLTYINSYLGTALSLASSTPQIDDTQTSPPLTPTLYLTQPSRPHHNVHLPTTTSTIATTTRAQPKGAFLPLLPKRSNRYQPPGPNLHPNSNSTFHLTQLPTNNPRPALHTQIDRLSTTSWTDSNQSRSEAVDACLASIDRLSLEVKDAASYIPAYDQRACGKVCPISL